MDFRKCIAKHVTDSSHKNTGMDWWDRLDKETASSPVALQRNIGASQLIPDDASIRDDICDFCKALSESTPTEPVPDAAQAITKSGAMICKGPEASDFKSEACSLLGISTFVGRYMDDRIRGPISPALINRVWDQLSDLATYFTLIHKTKHLKGGWLPLRFWTAKEDIDALRSTASITASRLGEYLGLNWSGRSLLIAIVFGKEPDFTVPTGWDGFDNPYFRENDTYKLTEPSTHFGYTLDLATNMKGAKETVSKPVLLANTRLAERLV